MKSNEKYTYNESNDTYVIPVKHRTKSLVLKGFRLRQGTKRAKALASVAHAKTKRFIELTGTPSPNGLQDLWGQAWFLDAGVRLGRTYDSFNQRWFRLRFDGYGYEPLGHSQTEIQDRLKDVCVSLDAKDYASPCWIQMNLSRISSN
jgi:hypothetical protein